MDEGRGWKWVGVEVRGCRRLGCREEGIEEGIEEERRAWGRGKAWANEGRLRIRIETVQVGKRMCIEKACPPPRKVCSER